MSNDIKEVIEIYEKLKEAFRYHYDYHKHMTILNAGSILIIIAILEGIFREPKGIIFIMFSIVCFVLSLICSLIVMTTITGITLTMTALHLALFNKNIKEFEEISDKAKPSVRRMDVLNKLHIIFYLIGIIILVLFAFINFL